MNNTQTMSRNYEAIAWGALFIWWGITELFTSLPDDLDAKYLRIESELLDRNDAQSAITGLAAMGPPPADNARLRIRHGFLLADAYSLAGHPDSALAVITQLSGAYPENTRIRERLDALQAGR